MDQLVTNSSENLRNSGAISSKISGDLLNIQRSCKRIEVGNKLLVSAKPQIIHKASVEFSRYCSGMDSLITLEEIELCKNQKRATDSGEKKDIIYKTVHFCYFREDFYSVGLAAFSSWIRTPARDLKYDSTLEAQKTKAIICEDPIIFYSNMLTIKRWAGQTGKRTLYASLDSCITCVSISHFGFLCHATRKGMIVISKLNSDEVIYTINYSDFTACSQSEWKLAVPTHIIWLHETRLGDSLTTNQDCEDREFSVFGRRLQLLIGDSVGRVVKLSLNYHPKAHVRSYQFSILSNKDNYHKDSICSMAIDQSERNLCVVGTDNVLKLWTHNYQASSHGRSDLHLNASINLPSAVRAINFCPGSSNILAFGGGRNDRTLRILQIDPLRILWEELMPAQIVATVWLSTRVVLVAYGHSRIKGFHGLAEIVDVTLQKVVRRLDGEGYALEAVKTQQGFCISTSNNKLKLGSWFDECSQLPPVDIKKTPMLR